MPNSFEQGQNLNFEDEKKEKSDGIFQSLHSTGIDELYFEKFGKEPDRDGEEHRQFATGYRLTPLITNPDDLAISEELAKAANRRLERLVPKENTDGEVLNS